MTKLEKLDELSSFKAIVDEIKQSKIEFVKIKLTPAKTKAWESKVGGNPYLVDLKDYPKDFDGQYLRLLAQINFEEIPPIAGYPKSGILQFFIYPDDVYGMNWDNPSLQDGFRVIYIKDIIKDEEKLIKDFSFLPPLEDDYYMPIEKECAMEFSKDEAVMSVGYYKTQKLIDTLRDISLEENDSFENDLDRYYEEFSGFGSKIGGYPGFTQADPRFYGNYEEFDTLLFQLDSDDEAGVLWGDVGIANFFINKDKLKELDFSEVLYNWDCS